MSIIYCQECDSHIDSDFEDIYDHGKEQVCADCQWNIYMSEESILLMIEEFERAKQLEGSYQI